MPDQKRIPAELPTDPDAVWEQLSEPTGHRTLRFWTPIRVLGIVGLLVFLIGVIVGMVRLMRG